MPVAWLRGAARAPLLRVPRPERLLFAPQDLRTSDPTVADDICGGLFIFAGEIVDTGGRSPFAVAPPSPAWERAVYGFGWLRHLRAADGARARDQARALVAEVTGKGRGELAHGTASEPRVVARRVISFLCQSPLVLNGADRAFYGEFLRAVGRGVATLDREAVAARRPIDRLVSGIALCYAALCCSGFENRLKRSTRLLSAELEAQILPDGGHVSRRPSVLVELLLDLLPLRLLYASRNLEVPEALARAIDRMVPMLRYLRTNGRDLGLFNGMGATAFDQIATLLSYDDVRGRPPTYAAQSGYLRLEGGATVVLADTGAAPPLESSAAAHAGCLSFEMSTRSGRLVVNIGSPLRVVRGGREAARRTAAHSTLALGPESSGEFIEDHDGAAAEWLRGRLGAFMPAGPREVSVERGTDEAGAQTCRARHDGYLARYGLVHERRWRLSADGGRLDGDDRLERAPGRAAAGAAPAPVIRFHLHPSVAARREPDGGAVLLAGPGVETWRFEAEGAGATVEESVFYGGLEGWRPTAQIVLRPEATAAAVRWSFVRTGGPSGDARKTGAAPG